MAVSALGAAESHVGWLDSLVGVATPDRREWIKIIEKTSNEAYQICFDGLSRIAAIGWRNIEYLAGAIESVELEQDFDAVVGRFVLMWLPDPLAVLERVVSHLRPGGVVAFQDNDFTFGVITSAPLPLFDKVNTWLKGTLVQDGPEYHMRLKMQHLYQRVGLNTPQLTFDAPIGTGNNWTG